MTYTAEIGISSKIALGDKCAVTVDSDNGEKGLESTDTVLAVDGDYSREEVTDAAEAVLTDAGWAVTGEWEDGDNSYYVTVEPAQG